MNHTDILDKYVSVIEAIYKDGDYLGLSFKFVGYLLIEFNHPQFFHRGKKQVNVHIYKSTSATGVELLVIPNDDPFDDYPFVPFIKYLGISENDISSWVIERYLETLRSQVVDVSSISFSV